MRKEINYQITGFNTIDKLDLSKILVEIIPDKPKLFLIEQIYEGNVNRNFKITCDEKKYFCKISPLWYNDSLLRESWALKLIKSKGCNVPSVIKYLNKKNNLIPGHEIMLLEYIEGSLLAGEKNISKFYKEIINIYNLIHSVEIKRFGWLNNKFFGKNKSWKDFLLQIENEEKISRINKEWNDNLLFVRKEIINFIYNETYCGRLLYGDFNYYNFIINTEKELISFDFQNCFSGDPLYDFGIILSKDINFEKYLKFINTYGYNNMCVDKTVLLYSLRHLLSMLAFYNESKNEERLSFIKDMFYEIKKRYEKY